MPRIEIGLATYNSAKFLRAQLDSLFSQTCQDFDLLVADDGSSDATLAILAEYKARFPHRIRLLAFDTPAGGACANFARITDAFTADYAMYCDHDDVWLPDKIELSMKRMRTAERRCGHAVPILVHTGLSVCGSDLSPYGFSYETYTNLDQSHASANRLLVQNVVAGCAALMNRALYELARPIPREATMHDHWVALVASLSGVIEFERQPTLLYRQHGGNAVGARSWSIQSVMQRAREILTTQRSASFLKCINQAALLLARENLELTLPQRRLLSAFRDLPSQSRLARLLTIRREGIVMDGALRNLGLIVSAALLPLP